MKSTDGLFARMNRRISIPISRQLIKTPITPNMVSLFTLALSLMAGLCFAFGGYWNCLTGAFLGVWGSILDGCDGEVARLKLQVSDFGCWLDTICDYLYYFVTFAGVIIGVLRTKGDPSLAGWSIAVFAGAILTFIVAGIGRKRLAGDHPEEYLQRWQSNAESRSAGLLVRMARHAGVRRPPLLSTLLDLCPRVAESDARPDLHGCDRSQPGMDYLSAVCY